MERSPNNVEKGHSKALQSQIIEGSEMLVRESSLTIDMALSQQERQSLERVQIDNNLPQFDFYGFDTKELEGKVIEYLGDMGQNDPNDISHIANVIGRLSDGMRKGFNEETTWTMIRVSLPNNEYKIPRWHPDGKYFKSSKKRYKLVATLKGPQTLFGEIIDTDGVNRLEGERRENYQKNEHDQAKLQEEDMRIRTQLQKVIAQKEIGGKGKAVVYLVGEEDAVFHSEPDISEPRIFVSVLPGSKEQVSQWAARTRN